MEPKQTVNAKKDTYGKPQAVELLSAASDLYVAKGKKMVHVNLKKDPPSQSELLKLVLGPTGNLRAPTLRSGKKLIVGFNEQMYQDAGIG